MAKKLFTLLVAHSRIDQNQSVAIFNQQRSTAHLDTVVGVGRISFLPKKLGDNTKHGTTVQLKIPTGYGV
jgi:hypothetical protein